MSYTPIFEKPYPNGYKDKPIKTTPITASTLNDKDAALEHIEDYLEANPIIDVEANPVLIGTEEALESIKIGNEKYKIEGGGGGASTEIIANDYDAEKTYNEGEYCAYNNTIWKSLSDSEGETPEEGEYWTEVVVMDEVEMAMNSGGSANVWEGSHAEYEEEKSQIADETTLLFNDDIGLEAESDYYSEVEQVIGTYMGKPLYRGYFNYGSLPSDNFDSFVYKNHGIANIDKITDLRGIVTFSDGNQARLPYSTTTGSGSIGIIANSTQVGIMVGVDRHTANAIIFLEYTKITDSVVGVIGGIKKGDNYSTNEQVIGTWIDGKPLYRRTWVTPTITSTGFQIILDSSIKNLSICNFGGAFRFISNRQATLPFFSRITDNMYKAVLSGVGCTDSLGLYVEGEIGTSRVNVLKVEVTIEYTKTTD